MLADVDTRKTAVVLAKTTPVYRYIPLIASTAFKGNLLGAAADCTVSVGIDCYRCLQDLQTPPGCVQAGQLCSRQCLCNRFCTMLLMDFLPCVYSLLHTSLRGLSRCFSAVEGRMSGAVFLLQGDFGACVQKGPAADAKLWSQETGPHCCSQSAAVQHRPVCRLCRWGSSRYVDSSYRHKLQYHLLASKPQARHDLGMSRCFSLESGCEGTHAYPHTIVRS